MTTKGRTFSVSLTRSADGPRLALVGPDPHGLYSIELSSPSGAARFHHVIINGMERARLADALTELTVRLDLGAADEDPDG